VRDQPKIEPEGAVLQKEKKAGRARQVIGKAMGWKEVEK